MRGLSRISRRPNERGRSCLCLLSRHNSAGSSSGNFTGNCAALEFLLICRCGPLADSVPVHAGFTPFRRQSLVEGGSVDTVHGVKSVFCEVNPAFIITQGQKTLFIVQSVGGSGSISHDPPLQRTPCGTMGKERSERQFPSLDEPPYAS